MPSPEANAVIDMYLQYRMENDAPGRTHEELRVMSDQIFENQPPALDAEVQPAELGGVATERTVASGADAERVVVYVHGGGYICGSARNQRKFLAELSRRAGAEVHAVEYRLAPEHPFPAAVDDVVAAYEGAIAAANGRPVVVGGDSAGGGLAIGSVVEMRRRGMQLPAAMFALSPWADMTLTGDAISSNANADVMVRFEDLKVMRECYVGRGDAAHPAASPALADLTGMPPLLVHVGSDEILAGDAAALVDAARKAGVDAQLHSADGMFHIYPVLAPDLPESQAAISSLAQFIRSAG